MSDRPSAPAAAQEPALRLLTRASARSDIDRFAGNKARSLYFLDASGAPVPRWAVIGADVFAAILRKTGLDVVIAGKLRDAPLGDASPVAAEIREAILAIELDIDIRALLSSALDHVGDVPLAVRSSGVEEDRADHSFAGQFDTFFPVRGLDDVCLHLKKCWASAYSDRSFAYRRQRGLRNDGIEIAVILQRLVHAEKSGVVFTVNPTSGDPDEMVISAVYGLGEALVSGAVDADTITLDRRTGAIKSSVIGEKRLRQDGAGLTPVPPEQRAVLSLSLDELERVRIAAAKVERALGRPQDIEFCIDGAGLWIVQSRPVTTPSAREGGELRIWDNSNIIENYPGVTSPLTFTFAQHVYSSVFREFCRLLWIPERHLREMDGFMGEVLGYMNGRVYYNLLHWYKLSGLAPFQSLGRKMMELQMGVDEPLDLSGFEEKIRAFKPASRLDDAYVRAVTGAKFTWYFATLERNAESFRAFFYEAYQKFDAIDYRSLPADQVYNHYRAFETGVIARWGKMIALESSIGLSYGLLRILTQKWIPDAPPWFAVAAIGGVEDVESVEPAKRLAELAEAARGDEALCRLLRETPAKEAYEALRAAGHEAFLAKIDHYIGEFGYRSNNELKLEEPDMREASFILFEMLKGALSASAQPSDRGDANVRRVEEILAANLGPAKRWAFERVRARVRAAIRARETVRFCRSRAFGLVRRMFQAIGEDFARLGVLSSARDIFFLRLDELRGCFNGTISHRELKPLVEQRRRDHAAYLAMAPLPPRFVTRGPIASALDRSGAPFRGVKAQSTSAGSGAKELRGTACSPGQIEGVAKVVREPYEFDGGVLVTYRTDPGWVQVFAGAQALLIERGSPLTHAAIVAREIGIPTIVQIPGLLSAVKTGMRLRVDGNAGRITILSDAAPGEAGGTA